MAGVVFTTDQASGIIALLLGCIDWRPQYLMKREQEGERFMKMLLSKPSSDKAVDDDIGFDDIQAPPPPFFKKGAPPVADFLYRFTSDDIKKIEAFVEKNKHLLKLPPPPKISLFEDVYMLMEFINHRELIKENQKKALDAICKNLQRIIRRSNVTIRERLTRKFVHMRVDEILLAIQQNRHLVFEKNDRSKKTYTYIQSQHSGFGVSPVKIEGHIDRPQESYKIQQKEDYHFDQDTHSGGQEEQHHPASKKEEQPRREEQPNSNGSIYKYGSMPIKERILIYANKRTKVYKPFLESKLEEVQAQIQQSEPQPPPPPPPPPLKFEFQFDSPMRQSAKVKYEEQDDISSDATFRSLTKEIKERLIGPIDPQPPERRFIDDEIMEQLEEQVLCKVSLNQKALQILKNDPSKRTMYVWQQQQDTTLLNFIFNSSAYAPDLRCMLKYKSFNNIMERTKYLNMTMKEEDEQLLRELDHQVSLAKRKETDILDNLKQLGR